MRWSPQTYIESEYAGEPSVWLAQLLSGLGEGYAVEAFEGPASDVCVRKQFREVAAKAAGFHAIRDVRE